MSVFMKRIDGVESADVSLATGVATVKLKPGNHVTVDEVRDAIRKNGYTPKAADATVAGKVVERNGQPALAVSGQDVVYALGGGNLAELQRLVGKDVVVAGHIPESQAKQPPTLQVREVTTR